jgi:hypothetical protein
MEFLVWVESTGLATWVRESPSLLAYPGILFLHTIGLALLVGASTFVSLRLMGRGSEMPLPPFESFFLVMWAGFWINALSGAALLIADATTKMTNPVFFIKMGFVLLAVITMMMIRRRIFRKQTTQGATFLALASLVLWTGAITAGRLMAYFGPVSGVPGLMQ